MTMPRIPSFAELLQKVKQPKVEKPKQYNLPAGFQLKGEAGGVVSLLSPRGNTVQISRFQPDGRIADFKIMSAAGKPVNPVSEGTTLPNAPQLAPKVLPYAKYAGELGTFQQANQNREKAIQAYTNIEPVLKNPPDPSRVDLYNQQSVDTYNAYVKQYNDAVAKHEAASRYNNPAGSPSTDIRIAPTPPESPPSAAKTITNFLDTTIGNKGLLGAIGEPFAAAREVAANSPNPVIRFFGTPKDYLLGMTPSELAGLAGGVVEGVQTLRSITEFGRQPQVKALNDFAKTNAIPKESPAYQDMKGVLRSAYNIQKTLGNNEISNDIMAKYQEYYTQAMTGRITPQQASNQVRALIAKYEPIIPEGTQTGAMAMGGKAANLGPLDASVGSRIATNLGVTFNGIQSGFGKMPDTFTFTDTRTGSSFSAVGLPEAQAKLTAMRAKFAAAEPSGQETPKAVIRSKKNYGSGKSVNIVEYEYGGERYITGTVVRDNDKSLGWYFGKGSEGLKEANRIALLSDAEFSKIEDDASHSWEKVRKSLSTPLPTPEVLKDYPDLVKQEPTPADLQLKAQQEAVGKLGGKIEKVTGGFLATKATGETRLAKDADTAAEFITGETPFKERMGAGTSVQTGLPGMEKPAQAQFFGEVSGKTSQKIPLTQVPVKSTELPGQMRLSEAQQNEVALVNQERDGEADFLQQQLKTDPVANYKFQMGTKIVGPKNSPKRKIIPNMVGLESFISIREQSFPEYLTVKQAQALNPDKSFAHYTQKGTRDYNKVPKEAALDQLTKEWGMTPDEIAERVDKIRQERAKIRELAGEVTPEELGIVPEEEGLQPEALPETPTTLPEEPPAPPVEPPQSVIKPEPQPKLPKDSEIKRIIKQSEEQVRQDLPGTITKALMKIPGLKSILGFERPGLKMTATPEGKQVLVAMVAENAARSDVSVWGMSTSLKLISELRKVFGNDVLHGSVSKVKFLGTPEQAKNPITGTLKDIADNPELYDLNNDQLGMLAQIEIHNDTMLNWVVENYGAEIGKFVPKENGAFLPNVDISEDVVQQLGSETRAVASGRGKTRIWKTARDRITGQTAFKPELDVEKLLNGLDSFKASAAGAQTYRQAIGGLTRLEAMKETHPKLYDKMIALKKKLSSLQGSAGTIEGNIHSAIYDFEHSPVEDADLMTLRDKLDVKLKAGPRKGMDVSAVQDEIAKVRQEIADIRPAWQAANLKPYQFVQEGLFRYFHAEQAELIKESRQITKNRLLGFIEKWRAGAFSGDLSPVFQQGVIGVLADPLGSLQAGIETAGQAIESKDIFHAAKVSALADDISNNAIEWGEYASLMGRGLTGTPQEYAAGFLSKIPGFDKFTESTYVTVTRNSFNLWQRTYKNMVKSGIPEIEAKVAAAKVSSEVYPLVNASLLGQSQERTAILRALPTSYSFIRQPISITTDAVKGMAKIAARQKLSPKESMSIKIMIIGAASTLATAALSAYLSAKAKGEDDEKALQAVVDAINPDPRNGKFASIMLGNVRVPLGGPYRALFRAMYPAEVKGVLFPVPFAGMVNFFKNRISPALSAQLDLLQNKDYSDNQIVKGNFPENVLRGLEYEFENVLPLTLGTLAEAARQGKRYRENVWQQVISQFMGVNLVSTDKKDKEVSAEIGQLGKKDQSAVDAALKGITNPDKLADINSKDWTYDMESLRRDLTQSTKYLLDKEIDKLGVPLASDLRQYNNKKTEFDAMSIRQKEDYLNNNPDFVTSRIFWGDQVSLPDLKTTQDVADIAGKYKIPLELIPAFQKTDKGLERIPSNQTMWLDYFEYYDLPSGSYLAMTKEQVDNGKLPDKYLKEWQTYNALKTDVAKNAFRKGHLEAAKGDWRDDFRRKNPDFDKWLQANKELKPVETIQPKKITPVSFRVGGTSRPTVSSIGGGFGSSGIRRTSARRVTFKKPRISMAAGIRAPRAPGV